MRRNTWVRFMTVVGVLTLASLSREARSQSGLPALKAPTYEADPFWPKTLPDKWIISRASGICVDAQDHVFIVNQGDLLPQQRKTAVAMPPVTEFDREGNLVNSWGDRELLPNAIHGCSFDYQGNIWFAGNKDGIVQKWSHDGKKLLQIGVKGKFDTADGTQTGNALNASHTQLNLPSAVAVDPANGDIYVSDGYGNRRVVVFDSRGNFLRQWGRQGTPEEAEAGTPGAFLKVLHCLTMGNDGLIYVCDREGYRIQVFDKMGEFQRNIQVGIKGDPPKPFQLISWISFSPDADQKYLYAAAGLTGTVRIINRATGEMLSIVGREGSQVGEIASAHSMAVDSHSDIYVADITQRRIAKFKLAK